MCGDACGEIAAGREADSREKLANEKSGQN
jgi:hypothetical protein